MGALPHGRLYLSRAVNRPGSRQYRALSEMWTADRTAESQGPMMQLGPDPVFRCTWCDRIFISRDRLVHHEAACIERLPRMTEFDRLLDRYEARLRADGLLRTKH